MTIIARASHRARIGSVLNLECTVFNISGNKYRLVSVIKYRWRIVYIRHILTHAEYDEGKWKL